MSCAYAGEYDSQQQAAKGTHTYIEASEKELGSQSVLGWAVPGRGYLPTPLTNFSITREDHEEVERQTTTTTAKKTHRDGTERGSSLSSLSHPLNSLFFFPPLTCFRVSEEQLSQRENVSELCLPGSPFEPKQSPPSLRSLSPASNVPAILRSS